VTSEGGGDHLHHKWSLIPAHQRSRDIAAAHGLTAAPTRERNVAAHAGGGDRNIRSRHSLGQLRLEQRAFRALISLPEALHQAVQCPDIVRMLRASLDGAAQSEIVTIDLLGLL
jgi:hypothetical protein